MQGVIQSQGILKKVSGHVGSATTEEYTVYTMYSGHVTDFPSSVSASRHIFAHTVWLITPMSTIYSVDWLSGGHAIVW